MAVAATPILVIVFLGVAAAWDARTGRIPDALNVAGGAIGLFLAVFGGWDLVLTHILAALVAASVVFGVRLLGYRIVGAPGMGWGDVKLAIALGLLVGWSAFWVLYLGAIVGAVVGLVGRIAQKLKPMQRVPFAPFVFVGAIVGLFLISADQVWMWLSP